MSADDDTMSREQLGLLVGLVRYEVGAVRREVERIADRWLPLAGRLADSRGPAAGIGAQATATGDALVTFVKHALELERLLVEAEADAQKEPLSDAAPQKRGRRW